MPEQQIEDPIKEKSEDKKDIEMEEREMMLNAENKAKELNDDDDVKKDKGDNTKEGMEVKPKKIPIGGIQMPGFFTRSKSKEKCKDEDQEVEGTELIEQNKEDNTTTQHQRIKLPNPFRKSKTINNDDENSDKATTDQKGNRKSLLDTIRLPLMSIFPKKINKNEQNLESQVQAGLASMETLDDKSGTDEKNHDDNNMKTIPLTEKDVEKQALPDEPTWIERIKTYRVAISAMLIFLLLLIIIIMLSIPDPDIIREAPIRNGKYVETITGCGIVEGLVEDSSVAFRGIPYARPPIGELRFKNAQPLNSLNYCWNGTLLAHNTTDECLQIFSNGTIIGAEDCLTLDIVTPYVRYDNPLPVIVLIGAESFMGGSPGKMRPSARFARSRDVVYVRPKFRLGALGFLSLDILSDAHYPQISGNYGLSDILQALKWIQLNIEHFGGDKKSVTLFGHQAGATMVTALTTMNNAKKYFTRAWATSGGALYPNKSRQEAEMENRSFLKIIDCGNVTCLQQMDAKKLITSIEDTWRKPQPDLPNKSEDPDKRHQWLVIDGDIIREHPGEVWAKELPVPLVIGTTAHSGASEKLLLKHMNWTEKLVIQHINESFIPTKGLFKSVSDFYPKTFKGLTEIISDIRTVCPLFAITTQMHKVPFYVVVETRGENNLADVDSDIDAILGRYEPQTTEQRRYVQTMQNLFYHYVWHGNLPINNDFVGQRVLIAGQDILPNITYSHCAFWIKENIVLPYAALD